MITYTISEPRTVMVHLWYTNTAHTTMMSSQRFPVSTSGTSVLLFLFCRCKLWNLSWQCERGFEVAEQSHKNKGIKNEFYHFAVHVVGEPFIHLVIHYIKWHHIQKDYEKSHTPLKTATGLVFSEYCSEKLVTRHAHFENLVN